MRRKIWDNENKIYVPILIYLFKDFYRLYADIFLIIMSIAGMLLVVFTAPINFMVILVMTIMLFVVDVVIKDYYKRKGL